MTRSLAGRRIVVPETREIDVLCGMLEKLGAEVVRCPLVGIRDVADPGPVVAWLERFVATPPDDLILFTGEGVQRLHRLAVARGLADGFVAGMAQTRTVVRGPKPARRLRELGVTPDLAAAPPTMAGIVASLEPDDLAGRRVAVQLYPEAPRDLIDFLRRRGAAADPVLPYEYASAADDGRVLDTIAAMAAGTVDLVTFTSSPQLRRLRQVARTHGREATLVEGLAKTRIAAVGPVVAAAVAAAGGTVAIAPPDNFHMRPMVNAIAAALG